MSTQNMTIDELAQGIWYVIHVLGMCAKTKSQKKDYIRTIKEIQKNFFCLDCKKHMGKYIKEHPFDPYYNMNYKGHKNIGFFIWGWEFHNHVNKRLGKPKMKLIDAINIYTGATPCEDCHVNSEFFL